MSQETPISAAIVDFVVTVDRRSYEDEILDLAKRCLVDWVGVSVGGTVEALAPVIRGAAVAIPSQGKARVLLLELFLITNLLLLCSLSKAYLINKICNLFS